MIKLVIVFAAAAAVTAGGIWWFRFRGRAQSGGAEDYVPSPLQRGHTGPRVGG